MCAEIFTGYKNPTEAHQMYAVVPALKQCLWVSGNDDQGFLKVSHQKTHQSNTYIWKVLIDQLYKENMDINLVDWPMF